MAFSYTRPDSPFIWISFKTPEGKRQRKNTGFRKENAGDRILASRLVKDQTIEEMRGAAPKDFNGWAWASGWIDARWGHKPAGRTIKCYRRYLFRWLQYFEQKGVTGPRGVTREHVLDYMAWRAKQGGGRNTSINEIIWLGSMLAEAVRRRYIEENPASGLELQYEERQEKVVWAQHESDMVGQTLEERDRYGWMRVTFLMGLWQAARMLQAQVPLGSIHFDRHIIDYPGSIVKGGKAFSQPINPPFFETLLEIANHRARRGKHTLCDIPERPSLEWRRFLDKLGLRHLSHHGLRATWITRAALAGVPEALSRRFVNHASQLVHQIYQKIGASDLLPMLDALNLKRQNELAQTERAATLSGDPPLLGDPTRTGSPIASTGTPSTR
jgi:hypothetical protein